MEFLAGAVRGLGLETNWHWHDWHRLASLGQIPFDPPNVAGWPGDKASPAWISTQAWITRVNFTNLLVARPPAPRRSRPSARPHRT